MEFAFREESDSLGTVKVRDDKYFGAQTQRSLDNFQIGIEKMPIEVIKAIGVIKKSAAKANLELGFLAQEKAELIMSVCDELLSGGLDSHFELSVWQTGSGTQTHMNVNEVIANRAIEKAGGVLGSKIPIHPNDDVNCSQSSNDVFPTAMHIAAVQMVKDYLLPKLETFLLAIEIKAEEFKDIIKVGRTHLMDAAPLTVGQEFSSYAQQIRYGIEQLKSALESLAPLALGATAVGTGLNCPKGFDERAIRFIQEMTNFPFCIAVNKFSMLSAHDSLVQLSSVLKLLATIFMKIGSDIRLLASGPRCGFGELILPANEPGSSIMPGKVNPTQCEALTMIAAQVIGNDVTVAIAASMGQLQLNVFKPVMIYNILQSIRLLSDGIHSFHEKCWEGIQVDTVRIEAMLQGSLMLATALNPVIGYDKAAKVVQLAYQNHLSLKEAAIQLGFLSEEEFDLQIDPKKMV